ncbi:MAG TPA: hypothetical protein PKO06_09270, partial [Candidatus Ozemobacteraceae bacterium]|nr:hypothetical protein [Candidatus Ozemobacteraceae bacterium]
GSVISPALIVQQLQAYVNRHLAPQQPFSWCAGRIEMDTGSATLFHTGGFGLYSSSSNTGLCRICLQAGTEETPANLELLAVLSPALLQTSVASGESVVLQLLGSLTEHQFDQPECARRLFAHTPFATMTGDQAESQTLLLLTRGGHQP